MATVEERLLPSAEPVQLIDEHGVPHDNPQYGMPSWTSWSTATHSWWWGGR